MDALKVVEEPARRLRRRLPHDLGRAVRREGGDERRPDELAASRRTSSANASQPTIYRLSQGASLVAYESHLGCAGAGHCLALRYYATESALLNGAATPQPGPAAHAVDLRRGHAEHLRRDGRPVEHRHRLSLLPATATSTGRRAGRCSNFDPATWSRARPPSIDAAILAAGASPDGNIGDRDGNLYERRVSAPRTRDSSRTPTSARGATSCGSAASATQLAIRTHGGSQAFANPTFTPLTLPSGQPGVVVTQFIPRVGRGARRGRRARLLPADQEPVRRRSRPPATSRARRTRPATTTRPRTC